MAPATQSTIWKYFNPKENESAQCALCNKIYSRKGRTTTSLKNHLKSMHPEEYSLYMSTDADQKAKKECKISKYLNIFIRSCFSF